MKAGLSASSALSSNSSYDAVKKQHDSESNSKAVDHKAVMPELMSWNAMIPVTLSCDSNLPPDRPPSPTSASEGITPVHVPEPGTALGSHTTVNSKAMTQGISETAAISELGPADCTAGNLYPLAHHSRVPEHQPQLSRAGSLTALVPEAPKSPARPINSSSSYHSCASEATAALAGDEATAVRPPPVADPVSRSAAADRSLQLSPSAAMAAAAVVAIAAMHRRLMEQQKMGLKLPSPAGAPAASSLLHPAQQPQTIATVLLQPQSGASTLQQPVSAATAQPGSPAAGSTAAVAASSGTKRSHSIMMQAPAGAPAAVAASPGRQQHHLPRLQVAGVAAAATAAAKEEVFRRTRAEALERYRAKRARRSRVKQIRYHLRKVNADKRLRIKGRFVSKEEMEKLGLLVPESVDKAVSCGGEASSASLASVQMNTCIHPAAAAAVSPDDSSTFNWEQQVQQFQNIQYADPDMPGDLLHSYDDLAHHMPTSTVAPAAPAAAVSAEAPSADLQGAAEVVALGVCAEMPDLPELPAAASFPLHFSDDFLSDYGGNMSHHHHDILML